MAKTGEFKMDRSKYKIGFVSLGCSKNLMDTEVMLHHLMEDGYNITPDETEADAVIINTCGFIESAKAEAIDNILDIAWLKENKELKAIIVTGCLAERYRGEIFDSMPEVDAVIGVGAIHKITEAVDAAIMRSDAAESGEGELGEKYSCFDDKELCALGGDRIVTTEHMAYLKIAEGCSNRCSYCAIPMIRGRMRSRTIEDIVDEAVTLDKMGIKELCLIAQDTSAYGIDIYGKYAIVELVREICKRTDIPWIRLLYCYPDKITDELICEMKINSRLLSYIDIPIQHINTNVLKRMNRHGDGDMIRDAVRRLREGVPGIVLRSTAIVGFPGETDEEFSELCEFIKEAKFERFGAFTYSAEEGTLAAGFENQIDEAVKNERYDIIMRTQLDISSEYNRSRIGKETDVLCEGYDIVAESYYGRSMADAPDIDGKVYFSSDKKIRSGEFVKVRITDSMDYDVIGEALK